MKRCYSDVWWFFQLSRTLALYRADLRCLLNGGFLWREDDKEYDGLKRRFYVQQYRDFRRYAFRLVLEVQP